MIPDRGQEQLMGGGDASVRSSVHGHETASGGKVGLSLCPHSPGRLTVRRALSYLVLSRAVLGAVEGSI